VQILKKFFKSSVKDQFEKEIKNILGLKPGNILLYRTALSHRSIRDTPDENNERLEYLGDAVLSAIVADYLFKRYPYKGEGFLTEMRSKMVNRQQLNDIAVKMGLKKITLYNKFDGSLKSSQIFGNTLEAVVGAIYLEHGLDVATTKVLEWFGPLIESANAQGAGIDGKTALQELAAAQNLGVPEYEIEEFGPDHDKSFTAVVVLSGERFAPGSGKSKREAEQVAAKLALEVLHARTS